MRGFLATNTSLFSGLSLNHVRSFLYVIHQSDLIHIDHIKRRYQENSRNFDSIFQFLYKIGAVQLRNDQLYAETTCNRYLSETSRRDFIRELLMQILKRKSEYRSEILAYLSCFEVLGEKVVYLPEPERRGFQSGVRNFLMELGVVSYDKNNDWYVISPKEYNLFALAKNDCAVITPLTFKIKQQAKEELGNAAELAVLLYEEKRLGIEFAQRIEHVASQNVAVGYDIESISLNSGGTVFPRYIEVKAVSSSRFSFYWTAKERIAAKLFRSWYFLYLLPVVGGGEFDFDGLRIIRDPYSSILLTDSEWVVEDNVIFCQLAKESSGIQND